MQHADLLIPQSPRTVILRTSILDLTLFALK